MAWRREKASTDGFRATKWSRCHELDRELGAVISSTTNSVGHVLGTRGPDDARRAQLRTGRRVRADVWGAEGNHRKSAEGPAAFDGRAAAGAGWVRHSGRPPSRSLSASLFPIYS